MARPGPVLLHLILITLSGASWASRLFAAEYGTQVTLPCDENVETPDETSALSVFDAVWTDPRGETLVGGGEDQDAAELRGDPWVDAFGGDLSLGAVDFADAGEYVCSARYADGEALTEVRESRHIVQVYEAPVDGQCECGCELVSNICLACSPGQYGKGGACHPCPIGRFNEHHAAVCCQHCPYLYLTWGRGAKSRHECSGVLHDLLIGLAVLACLFINLYALFKFTGPVVLDSLCEYVDKEGSESKPGPETGYSDYVSDSGMPENVFDGISRLIVRLKERKLPEGSEEDVPLLPASKSNARSEDSEVVAHDSDTALPDGEDFLPETVSPTPASPDDIESGAASLEDTFVSPELQSLDEGSTSSPDEAETSLSEVAFAGSPEADWIASGRRQWISRYHFVAGRSGTSEGHGDSSLPDERQATYDLYIGRWSNDEPDTSDESHSLEDKSSGIVGAKVRRTLGSSSRTATSLDDTAFDDSSVMLPPHSRAVSTRGNSSLDDDRFSGPSKFRPGELRHWRKPGSYATTDERASANSYSQRARGGEGSATEGTHLQRPEKRAKAPVPAISRRRGNAECNTTVLLTDNLSDDSRSKGTNARETAVASYASYKRQGATYRK